MTTLTPTPTARELGYRAVAEFEPVAAVWVSPPRHEPTWPGCLDEARWEHEIFCQALRGHVEVRNLQHAGIDTDDAWVRDYGPIFVRNGRGELACHDFTFNCWGGKYPPRQNDDAVPRRLAEHLGLPVWSHPFVLEGGSIDVNGAGTVLTTEQCLLNPNRNPTLSRHQIERTLHDALGTRHVIWLPGGIIGDDTDGHVDDVARFVNPTTVVAVRAPAGHPDAPMLERNLEALRAARDQDGHKLDLIELPAPKLMTHRFSDGVRPVPASYANFLIANTVVVVPIFDQPTDDAALKVIERSLPGRRVIGVPARRLVVGLGAVHCLTMQQPG